MISIVAGSGYPGPYSIINSQISPLLINLTVPSSLLFQTDNELFIADNFSLYSIINNEAEQVLSEVTMTSLIEIPDSKTWIWGDETNKLQSYNRSSKTYQELQFVDENKINVNLNSPMGLFYSPSEILYFIENSACVIRKVLNFDIQNISFPFQIETVVGKYSACGYNNSDLINPLDAYLNHPQSIWIDNNHNIFISDTYNHRIRMINSTSEQIITIAGNGTAGFDQDQHLAINSMLNYPGSIIGDNKGNIFIADRLNYRIRFLDTRNGILYTIAGIGSKQLESSFDLTNFYLGEISSLTFNKNQSLIFVSSSSNNQVYSFENTFSSGSSSNSSFKVNPLNLIIALVVPLFSISFFICFLRKISSKSNESQTSDLNDTGFPKGNIESISIATNVTDIENPPVEIEIVSNDNNNSNLPIATPTITSSSSLFGPTISSPPRRVHVQAVPAVRRYASPYSQPPFCSQYE